MESFGLCQLFSKNRIIQSIFSCFIETANQLMETFYVLKGWTFFCSAIFWLLAGSIQCRTNHEVMISA
eukprot:m.26622 g.26622  ORF g.26622 m.26622 type:complete len:68 (+) comp29421_c0_seq1:89-292(+)